MKSGPLLTPPHDDGMAELIEDGHEYRRIREAIVDAMDVMVAEASDVMDNLLRILDGQQRPDDDVWEPYP